jgi:hypothetical protein
MPQLQATQCRRITALLVPADDARPVRLIQVEDRARVFSEVIGGGLLEETPAQLPDGQIVALYLDEDRVADGLPANARAARLASYLRLHQRMPTELRGDLLVTGLDAAHADMNVPLSVLSAARRAGLISADI